MTAGENGNHLTLPKISIVTCSLNHGWCIEETIRSVIAQEYPNLEYIVIDGGSTDQTPQILSKYKKHFAYVVSEPDPGQGYALRKGLDRATGDILGWLCSDDLLEPGTLHEVGRLFASNPEIEVVSGDTIVINKLGRVIRRYKSLPFNRWLILYTTYYHPQPSTFWRRSLYDRVGRFNETATFMDAELFLKFSCVTTFHKVRRFWSRTRSYPETIGESQQPVFRNVCRPILRREYFGHLSPIMRLLLRVMAKPVRIVWRAATGCYW